MTVRLNCLYLERSLFLFGIVAFGAVVQIGLIAFMIRIVLMMLPSFIFEMFLLQVSYVMNVVVGSRHLVVSGRGDAARVDGGPCKPRASSFIRAVSTSEIIVPSNFRLMFLI